MFSWYCVAATTVVFLVRVYLLVLVWTFWLITNSLTHGQCGGCSVADKIMMMEKKGRAKINPA
jgi:hypothetical protein